MLSAHVCVHCPVVEHDRRSINQIHFVDIINCFLFASINCISDYLVDIFRCLFHSVG